MTNCLASKQAIRSRDLNPLDYYLRDTYDTSFTRYVYLNNIEMLQACQNIHTSP